MKFSPKQTIKLVVQFVKLQFAGVIIFVCTYLGYFISDFVFNRPTLLALAVSSLIAHIIYFWVIREWIFDKKSGKKRSRRQVVRFMLFMGLNYFLNLLIIEGLRTYFGISPYIGQILAGFIFSVWGYVGLKFWVFQEKLHPTR
jgi:putative flippase GtrA